MPHTDPPFGQFVWYNLVTNDPAGSATFYGGLFGWTTRDLHVGGSLAATTFRSGDHDVGGLVRAAAGAVSSQWLPFLGIENVEAAVADARRLGGEVQRAPGDGPPAGPAAVVLDPTGAAICLAAGVGSPDPLADAAMPGHFCWSELLTHDPVRAAAFYGGLVDWTTVEWILGDEGPYWLFRRGVCDVAGMMRLPDGAGHASFWLPYVQVVSAEETATLAEEFGGTIVTPPGDVPGRGRSAVVEDPGGARVAVFALTVAA